MPPQSRTPAQQAAFVTRMFRVFLLATLLVMMSQNLLAPNLTAAAASFGLDPAQRDAVFGGGMSMTFYLAGGPCSLLVGYLVDISNRKRLFLWVMATGNVVVALTAATTQVRGVAVVVVFPVGGGKHSRACLGVPSPQPP